MLARHLASPHRFVVLTDRPEDLPGYETILVPATLPGWWAKMALFEKRWRAGERVLYFDLDTVICGDLAPLADLQIDFGICANFTRAAGHPTWPCRYGSCVMTIGPELGEGAWNEFQASAGDTMERIGGYGDQMAIEELIPEAELLQGLLPKDYFVHYRKLTDVKPEGCALVIFGGSSKPSNCTVPWARDAWK